MANTPNYNLLIPSPTGTEDVHQSLADNFNKIDTGIKASDDKAQSVKDEVTQARTSPDGSVQPNLQAAIKWVYDNVQQQTLGVEIVPMIGASPNGTKYEISFDDLGGVITTVSTGAVRSLVGTSPSGNRFEITFENDGDIVTTATSLPATTLTGSAPNGQRYDITFEDDGDLVTTANESPMYAQTTTEVQSARTDSSNKTFTSLKARIDSLDNKGIDNYSTFITRDVNGLITLVEVKDGLEVMESSTVNRGVDGVVTSLVEIIGTKTVTTTLNRDGNGIITSITKGVI